MAHVPLLKTAGNADCSIFNNRRDLPALGLRSQLAGVSECKRFYFRAARVRLGWLQLLIACLTSSVWAEQSAAQRPASSSSEITSGQQTPAEQTVGEPAPTAEAKTQLQAEVTALIDQLGDSNYHRRENAKWQLERIGLAAFEQLRKAAEGHSSPHVALAARYLIDSQNVVWWLETDSLEVRELLTTYNDSSREDRDTVLQQLSERGTPDALLALCRLARFESNEQRSKSAALYLMQAIAEQLSRDATWPANELTTRLPASIKLTLGESNRIAAQWLLALMDDVQVLDVAYESSEASSEVQTERPPAQLKEAAVTRWQQLIAQEHATIPPEAVTVSRGAASQLERPRSVAVTLRFYRWLGLWLTEYHSRSAALDTVRGSVELIGSQPHALQTAAEWALEADLPELVVELSEAYSEQFAAAPELGFFLAEGHLRLGDEKTAQRIADRASDSILELLKDNLQNFANLDLDEIRANRHYQLAGALADRGMHQWAEQEYLRSLEFESRLDARVRTDLAQFYWSSDEYQKAADVLWPLAKEMLASPDLDLPIAPGERFNPGIVLANYYFYRGLADLKRGAKHEASDNLRKSLEVEPLFPNPDAVIAMRELSDEEPFASYYREHFEQMSKRFRIRVLQAEEQMSRAVDRMSRAMAGPNLATECNQLAWLLSKCEVNPNEALNLSLRSLELVPDEPAYLDTLARCYFAAGEVENAVRVQKRAVQLAPHVRQMAAQLKEFEAALQTQ